MRLVFLLQSHTFNSFITALTSESFVPFITESAKTWRLQLLKNYSFANNDSYRNGPIIYSPAGMRKIASQIRLTTVIYGAHRPTERNRHMTQLLIHCTNLTYCSFTMASVLMTSNWKSTRFVQETVNTETTTPMWQAKIVVAVLLFPKLVLNLTSTEI